MTFGGNMFYEYYHFGSSDYMNVLDGTDLSYPPHLHRCFEIIIILSGQMEVTVDGKSFTLNKHEAVLIFPNQIHSLSSAHSQHILSIFSPQLVQAYFSKVADKMPESNKFTPDPYLTEALIGMQKGASIAMKKGLLYLLCGQFDSNAAYYKKQNDKHTLLFKIFSFVENNFAGDCSLANLSNEVGYNYAYLSRYFKKTVGQPYNTFVTHYRLSHACYLLESTDQPIIQCALDSGFTSIRSFNRSFKEKIQTSPTQYRINIHL